LLYACSGILSVPVEEYKSNLAAMVAAARKAGVPHILLLTPPPVDEAAWAKAVSVALQQQQQQLWQQLLPQQHCTVPHVAQGVVLTTQHSGMTVCTSQRCAHVPGLFLHSIHLSVAEYEPLALVAVPYCQLLPMLRPICTCRRSCTHLTAPTKHGHLAPVAAALRE
jgi:hypothetical protein